MATKSFDKTLKLDDVSAVLQVAHESGKRVFRSLVLTTYTTVGSEGKVGFSTYVEFEGKVYSGGGNILRLKNGKWMVTGDDNSFQTVTSNLPAAVFKATHYKNYPVASGAKCRVLPWVD